ncbi:DUF3995 domain-containing protein [Deinococcus taeanensis]|uniref:DUF3995 domain-containing protein n=1 Tax=Deinococcus taeanensis TaxID=2737050 RepID=UPI001CDC2F19|nr:DUF3995 domain-containing protein [Deinococcus taeanensis]UBV41475.1 DUF3995 domain-containing protein [Deinococcus taeanensis]
MEGLIWPVAVVLSLLATLHVAWGRGAAWPGRNVPDLAQKVVGGPRTDRMPSPVACYAVAAALLSAAAILTLAAAPAVSSPVIRFMAFTAAGVFLLRGAAGYVLPRHPGQDFDRLNRWLYSPLCLALGGLSLLALMG